ncbi:MAG: glycosyltransferase family 4 protein [Bacteroidales bacterium]|nr:glycosyltransferase family 4 protein [Bacteroidales bacterium]
MKVLVIANYKKSIGGISGQVEVLLENFNNDKIKFNLFNTKASNFCRLLSPFKLLIKGLKYDIFHIHGCSFKGFFPIILGVIIGKVLNKKTIITYHGGGLQDFLDKHTRLIKYFLSKADIITVPSEFLQDILGKYSLNSILLPNVIREDNVEFKKRDIIRPYITVTRSLEAVYNIPLVIEAFMEIKKKYKNAKLCIIGDGSLKEKLKNKVKVLGIKDIEFVGKVKNSEIGKELNKSDIFINPTTKDSFSVSMFEAFACGLPVISTNVGAIPNYLIDGENGMLIDPGSVEQLISKIEYILGNQVDTQIIIANAYKALQKYTLRNLKNKYIEIYK